MKFSEVNYSSGEMLLLRRALRPANSSAALMAKAKSIEELARLEVPVPRERIREQLLGVINKPSGAPRMLQKRSQILEPNTAMFR